MTQILEKIAFRLYPFVRPVFAMAILCGVGSFLTWNKLPPYGAFSMLLVGLWFFGLSMITFTFYPSQTDVDDSVGRLTIRRVSHFHQMSKNLQIYVKIFFSFWFGLLLLMSIQTISIIIGRLC